MAEPLTNFYSGRLCAFVDWPTNQNETPVAITAIHKTRLVDFQEHARMAERSAAGNLARAVTGDAGFIDADGFGRRYHRAPNSNGRRAAQFALSVRLRHVFG